MQKNRTSLDKGSDLKEEKALVTSSSGLRRFNPSKKYIRLFVIMIALLGTFFIVRSFAATEIIAIIEGENLSYKVPSTTKTVIYDNTASGGKALAMYWSSWRSQTIVNFSKSTQTVSIRAKGSTCQNTKPIMILKVDNKTVSFWNINSSWQEYTAPVNITSGPHGVALEFLNDYMANGCDRNLYIDKMTFLSTTQTPSVPLGLRAIGGNGYADLAWNSISGASGYIVETKNGFGQWQQITSTLAGLKGTTYRANSLVNGQNYSFRVRAFNSSGAGAYSEVSVTPSGPVVPFNAAKASGAYRDTIGANAHIHYGVTFYPKFEEVRSRLKEAGIRHLRAGIPSPISAYDNWFPKPLDHVKALMNDGVKFLWGAGTPKNPITSDDLAKLKPIKSGIDGFETQNEWNNNDYATSGGGPYTGSAIRSYLKIVHDRIRLDSAWSNTPIVAPTEAAGQKLSEAEARQQLGDITSLVDKGNMHPYSGDNPGTNLGPLKNLQVPKTGNKPIWITEFGYTAQPKTDHFYMSERAAGIYAPRYYLEAFKQGFERSYWFTLIDDYNDPNTAVWNFGLLKNDISPRPSFTAIKNLNNVVGDGKPTVLGGVRYKISSSATDVRSLLLQSSDGSYSLALWRNVRAWSPDGTKVDLYPASVPVTVTFGESFNVSEYHPTTSAASTKLYSNPVNTQLNIGAEVTVLKLRR